MITMTAYPRRLKNSASRTRGFTLVEVLVSLVILSIGLLGIAKLMLFSSRANDSAYLRSQATDLAYQMLDYMRANTDPNAQPLYATLLATPPVNPGVVCIGAPACSNTNLALFDVYQWKLRLNATSGLNPPGALPNGQGQVVMTQVGSQTQVTITVQWDDTVAQSTFGNAAAPTQSIVLETTL